MVHNRYPGYDLRYGPVRGSTIILRHGPEQKISWLSKHTYGKPSAHVRPSLWAPFRPKIIRGSSSFVSGRHKAAHDYGLGSQACPACHKSKNVDSVLPASFLKSHFPRRRCSVLHIASAMQSVKSIIDSNTGKVGDTWCVENDTFDENGAYFYLFSTYVLMCWTYSNTV